jgi:iron complex transport system substrate-binding protein
VKGPRRIVCLTEETTETLYLLGEEHRIVGISGFTVRPPRARKEKPRVSAYTSARIDKIIELKPDLVLGFSDLQADIMADLVRRGIEVHIFNQRTVAGILSMIETLGALVHCNVRAQALANTLHARLEIIGERVAGLERRPKVYFEEWNEPLITAIGWVSELIVWAGGEDIFADRSHQGSQARERIVTADEVIQRKPDIILGSWCGRKFRPDRVMDRPGWDVIPAVRDLQVFEIKSCDILQPGPAALTDGVGQLVTLFEQWSPK